MHRADYEKWENKRVATMKLRLDKDNPRIPISIRQGGLCQPAIREYLVENEHVLELAESISKHGYIPHDPIYVIKDGNYYNVIEGNRRTCAIQLMIAPDKSPRYKQSAFKRYSQAVDLETLKKLPVIIAPSREEVRIALYLRHALGNKPWTRQQKNNFIANNVLQGKTIEEIAIEFKETPSQIVTAVIEVLLQQLFLELELSTEDENQAISPQFELSTLSRIIGTAKFKELTGLHIDGAKLVTTLSKEKFKRILKRIVLDLLNPDKKNGGQDSRTLSSAGAREKYLVKIFSEESSEPEAGDTSFAYAPFGTARGPIPSPVAQVDTMPKARRKKEVLISRTKLYETGNDKLDMLIQQAQKMPIDTYTIAGSLLLRTIFELAVLRMFEKNNKLTSALNSQGRSNNLSSNVKALANRKEWFSNSSYCDTLLSFCSNDNISWTTLETLNRYVHTNYIIPDKDILRSFWSAIKPLIDECCSSKG